MLGMSKQFSEPLPPMKALKKMPKRRSSRIEEFGHSKKVGAIKPQKGFYVNE